MKKFLGMFITVVFVATSARATVVVSSSATAPTPGAFDQSNITGGGFAIDPNGGVTDHGPVDTAQGFTTPAGGPFQLDTISVKTGNIFGNPNGWQIRVSALDGAGNLTPITFTSSGLSLATPTSGDWVTFTFTGVPTLAANTLYGFDIFTDTTSFNSAGIQKSYSGNAYAGGDWLKTGSTAQQFNPGYIIGATGQDLLFNVGLSSAVPEPSTILLLLGGGGLVWWRRRK